MGRFVFWTVWILLPLLGSPASAQDNYALFESGPVRPLALSPDGSRLFLCNVPDGRLEIFAVSADGLVHQGSVAVGLEPVAVAARTNDEVWVVNHLSDSVSIVDVPSRRVVRTLLVGDEPRDIVFAGPGHSRAFITAAHRGQNRPGDPELLTPGIGRSDVWVFDSADLGGALGGTPLVLLNLFGDTPRALAATPDGSKVFAAVFHSGNQTTVIPQGQVPQIGPFLTLPMPPPADTESPNTIDTPSVGVMAKYDSGTTWKGATGASYTNKVPFLLPDHDVFTLDANASPPAQIGVYDHVGTILYNMAVNPVSGAVYVSNTDANNMDRFEGFATPSLRGELHKARISILTGASTVAARHLNKHIDYAPAVAPPEVNAASLAIPTEMAVTSDGSTLYLAAFGSQAIGVFDTTALADDTFTPSAASQIALSAGGPGGVVIDENNFRLYVYTRFDDGLSVVDLQTNSESAHLVVHSPEPAPIRAGRVIMFDARNASSNGEASCGVCHVFSDFDSLAWDLGAPEGSVILNDNPFVKSGVDGPVPLRPAIVDNTGSAVIDFHPLKGPMTTQTLRGMEHDGPMHNRGDRSGGGFSTRTPFWDADPNSFDEHQAFVKFNVAFVGLLGRANQISAADMSTFADYALRLQLPPNPIHNLDGTLTASQAAGSAFFSGPISDPANKKCSGCHTLDPSAGAFGTSGLSSFQALAGETQHFKTPQLRSQYQKVGMFGRNVIGLPHHGSATSPTEQVRGYGYFHDGSVDSLTSFMEDPVFTLDPNNAIAGQQRIDLANFMLAFPSDLAPIVGQQVTLTAANADAVGPRIDLLIQRAETDYPDVDRAPNNECDLIVKGIVGGAPRGWWMSAPGVFTSDKSTEPTLSDTDLRQLAANTAGQELTYTCVPPGEGLRLGIDRGGVGDLSQPDGIRDAEQCGDVTADGVTASADVVAIRQNLALLATPAAPGKCNVNADGNPGPGGDCDIVDVAVIRRAIAALDPPLAPVCTP